MNPHVAIAIGIMRSIMKEYDFRESFARQLSDARLVRQSADVIARATDKDIMETMADVKWKAARNLMPHEPLSSRNEGSGSTSPAPQAVSDIRREEGLPQTCVHLARHVRT